MNNGNVSRHVNITGVFVDGDGVRHKSWGSYVTNGDVTSEVVWTQPRCFTKTHDGYFTSANLPETCLRCLSGGAAGRI